MQLHLFLKGKCVAFLNGNLSLDMHLSELRSRLKAEVDELMPSSYTFLYKNIPIGANQETRLPLHYCLEKSNLGVDLYLLYIAESETTRTAHDVTEPAHQKTSLEAWLQKNTSLNPEKKNEKDKRNSLPSSTNTAVMFTDKEIISQPCWLERERRKYWNFKFNSLHVSKVTQIYNKNELFGVIDTALTLKKAELLQIRACELRTQQESLESVYRHWYDRAKKNVTEILAPSKNISKNEELVSQLLFCIKNENDK